MYEHIISDIYSIFGSTSWDAVGIKAVPWSYQGDLPTGSYARVSVLTGIESNLNHSNSEMVDGIVIISIFADSVEGDFYTGQIVDKIRELLTNRIVGKVELKKGSLKPLGADRDDPRLHRSDYSIKFTYRTGE